MDSQNSEYWLSPLFFCIFLNFSLIYPSFSLFPFFPFSLVRQCILNVYSLKNVQQSYFQDSFLQCTMMY